MPKFVEPMLARLTYDYFSDPQWVYERKFDGERAIGCKDGSEVRLLSRNNKLLNSTYPELVDALSKLDANQIVVDGEIVAFEGKLTSFSKLQQRMQIKSSKRARDSGVNVFYYLFDIPYFEGYCLDHLPLRTRKLVLRNAIVYSDPLRFTPHRNEHGLAYLEEAQTKGWEGLIAKRADAPYQHGRSRDWLKFKCGNRQELVIGGFTEPRGSRVGLGALLLGYYEGKQLRYAGKVGTGFDTQTLISLREQLDAIRSPTRPFIDDVDAKSTTWTKPEIVAEIGFTEWTHSGKLRHPRFVGLRYDKPAKKVVRELP